MLFDDVHVVPGLSIDTDTFELDSAFDSHFGFDNSALTAPPSKPGVQALPASVNDMAIQSKQGSCPGSGTLPAPPETPLPLSPSTEYLAKMNFSFGGIHPSTFSFLQPAPVENCEEPLSPCSESALSQSSSAALLIVPQASADLSATDVVSEDAAAVDTPAPAAATQSGRKVSRKSPPKADKHAAPSARGRAGKRVGNKTETKAKELSNYLKVDGILPPDHRPARGRGRQSQLKQMTKEQIEAEAAARLEKNRLAARDCRKRRKFHLSELENKVAIHEARDLEQQQIIEKLRQEVADLRSQLGL